jgi:hypothetical protein
VQKKRIAVGGRIYDCPGANISVSPVGFPPGKKSMVAKDVYGQFTNLRGDCIESIFLKDMADYNLMVSASNKLTEIDSSIKARRLANKKKDDLTIYDLVEILRIFRGGMGEATNRLIFWRNASGPQVIIQGWVCQTLKEIQDMGKQWDQYADLARNGKLFSPPESQLTIIERERLRLDRNVNPALRVNPTPDKVLSGIAGKKLSEFYDGMARERAATQQAVEAFVGGKGPLKDYLPQTPFFWLVALFPLVCCFSYLLAIASVNQTIKHINPPDNVLHDPVRWRIILAYRKLERDYWPSSVSNK